MTTGDNTEIPNVLRGNSRAAQNRAIRRDALREELKAREYIRQVSEIASRLDPQADDAYSSDQVQAVKARADIYFRLLDKCLPNLRPVDMPITMPFLGGTLTEDGRAVLTAIGQGDLSPQEAVSLLTALTAQARILEVDELEKRIAALESQKGGAR